MAKKSRNKRDKQKSLAGKGRLSSGDHPSARDRPSGNVRKPDSDDASARGDQSARNRKPDSDDASARDRKHVGDDPSTRSDQSARNRKPDSDDASARDRKSARGRKSTLGKKFARNRKSARERRPLSRTQKAVFTLITVSIPLIFFILLELALRITGYGGNTDLFVFPERYDGRYGQLNPHYHDRFFYQTTTFTGGRGNVFLTEKPENGFRIFVLGASTTESFPYGFNGVFSLVVQDMLTDALPDNHVEVVNIGITATNSYTLYDKSRKLLDYEPDAVMIYSGQNEYYGALGVASTESIGRFPGFVRFYLDLQQFRTFMLIRNSIGKVSGLFQRTVGTDRQETGMLMERMVRRNAIPLDSRIYRAGINQYESNLDAVLRLYRDHDVPVFIAGLASNLKDHPPFHSMETDQHPAAMDVWNEARSAYRNGEYDQALTKFRYARDLDMLRFRAPSVFNEIIREKAEEHGARYVPLKEVFSDHADNGIIGFDLMLEHLHPNSEGYFLMGNTFFEAIAGAGLPGISPDTTRLASAEHYRDAMHLTELDHRIVWHRVQNMNNSWPFVDRRDPHGYPFNYTPENRLDSLAMQYTYEEKEWHDVKTELAQWYVERQRYGEALEEMLGIIRAVPYEAGPYENAARIAMYAEWTDEAAEYLEKAIRISPGNYSTRTLAGIEANRGNYERATRLFEQAYELNRSDYMSLYHSSVTRAGMGDFDRAIEIVDRLDRINPDFPNLQNWRDHLIQVAAQARSQDKE